MLIEVCRDPEDPERWIWRIISRNGRTIVTCPTPYLRKKACVDIAEKIASGITRMSVES